MTGLQQPQDGSAVPAEPPTDPAPSTDRAEGSEDREAASWRRRLRTVEAERDRLAGLVERGQRRDVEALAASVLRDPADAWLTGLQLGDVLDEAGEINRDRLAGALDEIARTHPHWRAPVPSFDGGVRVSAPMPGPTMSDVLRTQR